MRQDEYSLLAPSLIKGAGGYETWRDLEKANWYSLIVSCFSIPLVEVHPMKLFRKDEIDYVQLYMKIKRRCEFQLNFSCFLLGLFFVLQYSVPICLVLLGSITTSKEQIVTFVSPLVSLSSPSQSTNVEQKQTSNKDAEILASEIIFFLGLVTILLGVINNTIRPAESYDTCSNYNNKFNKFIIDLDLDMVKLGGLPEKSHLNPQKVDLIYQVLMAKNKELFELVDEYNKARSLSPRQANIEAINQKDDKQKSKDTNSTSSKVSDDTTGNFLADAPNTLNESSNGTSNKSLVEIPTNSN
ncbi:hypothetical protein [Allocoleopsis sp.]|uniref:hypothetical protein n=1 Tax=Allocoleopsis sp. TaxID=3088169 RepID=UPI002FD7253F